MNNLTEFKKPINLISLFLGIFGIVLSFIFYFKEHKIKEISYLQNGNTSLIFDSKSSMPSIKLYDEDTILIKQNVYLFTGKVWNSGDIPISQEDIRIPLSFNLGKGVKILEYKILKQKDSAISNFTFSKINNQSLRLNWKYFDPSFGFVFQIIYQNNSEAELKMTGKILGINDINYLKENEIKNSEIWNFGTLVVFIMTIVLLYVAIFYKEKSKFMKIFYWIMFLFMLFSTIYRIYMYFKYLHLHFNI